MEFKIETVKETASQTTVASDDLQVSSTSWEEITNIQPLDKDTDVTQVFEKLWATLNQARRTMIQRHSDQLCQAHNKYMNQARELDSLELTQEQREHHQRSLEQHHKHIWYSITRNHSYQRINFVIQEETTFRQKLDEIRKKDVPWDPTDYNFM